MTWGTSPEDVCAGDRQCARSRICVEDDGKRHVHDSVRSNTWTSPPGTPMTDMRIDKAFIGSCTNGRIEDIRAAAKAIAKGRKVAGHVHAMVVPGSGMVKDQAEARGPGPGPGRGRL